METVDLIRNQTGSHGTFGILRCPNGLKLFTAEPPWKDNRANLSCLPEGDYTVARWKSNRFGHVYIVEGTAPRTHVLFHSGNLAGDTELGFTTHTHGCILPALKFGHYKGQKAVLGSRPALNKFIKVMGGKGFNLRIKNLFNPKDF